MWVCTECNQEYDRPEQDWKKNWPCPYGHSMFSQNVFGTTRQTSYLSAVGYGLAFSFTAFIVLGALSWLTHWKFVGDITGIFFPFALPVLAWTAFWQGRKWKKRGGAVALLAPRAYGIATGYLLFSLAVDLLVALNLLHIVHF